MSFGVILLIEWPLVSLDMPRRSILKCISDYMFVMFGGNVFAVCWCIKLFRMQHGHFPRFDRFNVVPFMPRGFILRDYGSNSKDWYLRSRVLLCFISIGVFELRRRIFSSDCR